MLTQPSIQFDAFNKPAGVLHYTTLVGDHFIPFYSLPALTELIKELQRGGDISPQQEETLLRQVVEQEARVPSEIIPIYGVIALLISSGSRTPESKFSAS